MTEDNEHDYAEVRVKAWPSSSYIPVTFNCVTFEQQNNAGSRRIAAEAEAYEKQQLGEAEAAAIKAKVYGSGRASNFYLSMGPGHLEMSVKFLVATLHGIANASCVCVKYFSKLS